MLDKLLRAIHRIIQLMTELSAEERVKKLVELDKANTEIKSLAGIIRVTADKLEKVTDYMRGYVITHAQRMNGSYVGNPPDWQPSQFDLAQLREQQMRLEELVRKRDELEKQLGVRMT